MLSIKVVYNEETKDKIPFDLKINPIFEFFNESNPKEVKKAWKYKGCAGARQLPFIGVFENNTLIKAFYAEDGSSEKSNFLQWLESFIKEHAKKGYIKVTKLEGNESNYKLGTMHEGYTENFTEGVGVHMQTNDRWFHTSIIKSIDWEAKTFKTLNSTYSFEFNERTGTPTSDD